MRQNNYSVYNVSIINHAPTVCWDHGGKGRKAIKRRGRIPNPLHGIVNFKEREGKTNT